MTRKGQHQRPHKRTLRKSGKTFKAGRGKEYDGSCPLCGHEEMEEVDVNFDAMGYSWLMKCPNCKKSIIVKQKSTWERCDLPNKKHYVVSRVLQNGVITTNMYETTKRKQNKLVAALREKYGPSAGITKGTVEINGLPTREPLEGARHHKLMPADLRKTFPKLYAQEKVKDPIVYAKYFSPYSGWTWYATEFDGTDRFFGLVKGFETELGYFSLQEMAETNRNGLPLIERDIHFTPKRLSEVRKEG